MRTELSMSRVSMNTRAIRAASALLLGVVVSTTGCTISDGEALLVTFEPTDEPLSANFWAGAEKTTDATAHRTTTWLVPFVLNSSQVELEGDKDQVRYVNINGLNPGLTLLPMLPFYVTVDYGRWYQSGAVERRGFTWTPLWAWDSSSGDSQVRLEAGGWPLLWGNVLVDGPEDGIFIDIDHFLLTLGPLHMKLNMGRQGQHADGYMFYPAYAAGLGGILWASYSFDSSKGHETAHGPLMGYLGYLDTEGLTSDNLLDLFGFVDQDKVKGLLDKQGDGDDEPKASNPLIPGKTLVLGGILWSSFTEKDTNGVEMFGSHGPLWGMFGYGKKNGHDTIRLFWIPIQI